jgi:hypothetical protein
MAGAILTEDCWEWSAAAILSGARWDGEGSERLDQRIRFIARVKVKPTHLTRKIALIFASI